MLTCFTNIQAHTPHR